MNYNLKKPCKECPYLDNMPGWIGAHDSAMEFHDMVQDDKPFACHLTHNNKEPSHCAGYAMYMTAIFKRSKYEGTLQYQNKLYADGIDDSKLLDSLDGVRLVGFHGK